MYPEIQHAVESARPLMGVAAVLVLEAAKRSKHIPINSEDEWKVRLLYACLVAAQSGGMSFASGEGQAELLANALVAWASGIAFYWGILKKGGKPNGEQATDSGGGGSDAPR